MHILSVFDELDSYLDPYTPEIHRVRIPPLAGERGRGGGGQVFRSGNGGFCCSSNVAVDGFTKIPKPCDNAVELVKTGGGISGGGLPGGWDQLKLGPEGLKEPSQGFVEGFEKLPHLAGERVGGGGEVFLSGNGGFCCSNNVAVDEFTKYPKPCDNAAELVETSDGISGGGLAGGRDQLKLGPEGLKEPSQGFLEGFEKLPPLAGERGRGGGVFRSGNGGFCCSNNVAVHRFTKNPKPCDNAAELMETSCGISGSAGAGAGLAGGWDQLKLGPEGLKEPSQSFVEGFEKFLEMKFGIMALRIRHGLDAWTLGSHMVNPFEVLSYVAATSTLNRAYFKMWELIQTFQLVPYVSEHQRFLSAHLCEGPGGFVEAVLEYRARSSNISEEVHQDACKEAVDEEPHTRNSSQAHRNSSGSNNPSAAPCRLLPLNNRNEDFSCRSAVSTTSGATSNGPKNYASTGFNNGSDASSPKAGSGSPGIAAERFRVVQVGKIQMSMLGGCSQANQLKKCSRVGTNSSSAEVNGLHEFDRYVDTRDAEESGTTSCKTLPWAGSWTDALPNGQSEAAVRGENLADNSAEPNLRSFVKTSSMHYQDLWFGLTLAASTQQCAAGGSPPPMMEMTKVGAGNGNAQGHLHFGMDGSGDLTDPANVNAFVVYTLGRTDGQRMDLITADGAFDVSEDFSSQEHSHLHLVFCEVVSALMLQAEGGSFVLKLFDCYTASTLTILFILSLLYKNVEIVRLRTTRICNSERYVVAGGFLGLNPQLETILLKLNEEWSIASLRGDKIGLFLSGGFPEQLLQAVMESNAAIAAVQIDGINRALQLADVIGERLPTADSFGKRKRSISMLRRKLQTQKRMQRNAISLCKALNIPCRSHFCSEQ